MNKDIIKIETVVGLDDSELISYRYFMETSVLMVEIKTWNLKKIIINFFEPILFLDRGCQSITTLCQCVSDSSLLREALEKVYETPQADHSYKLFQLLDLDDNPSIEVVYEKINIETEELLID